MKNNVSAPKIIRCFFLLIYFPVICSSAFAGEGYGALPGSSPVDWPTPDPTLETMSFPISFDWREHGGVTPVKDQGMTPDCYPCWAFSLIGACESAFTIATGIEWNLSEQQLIDCNTNGFGCNGGFVNGWTALRDYGAVTADCYPFAGEDGECVQSGCEPAGWVAGVYPVAFSINSLKYALMHHGALSCSMTIYNDIMLYSGGCYENPGTQAINHGVVIIGWDDAMCNGDGAWIVRNSWGTHWGDEGVAYMKYGTANIGRHAQWFEYSPDPMPQGLHYRLFMPKVMLAENDWFILETRFGNASDENIDCLEFILLDVHGEYYFYPAFTSNVDWAERHLKAGTYWSDIVLLFQWPGGIPEMSGLLFYGACFDATSIELLAVDMIEWGSV